MVKWKRGRMSGLEISIESAAMLQGIKGMKIKYLQYLRIISTHFPSKIAESFLLPG